MSNTIYITDANDVPVLIYEYLTTYALSAPNVKAVNLDKAFNGILNSQTVKSVDFSSLETINANYSFMAAFENNGSLTSCNFSSLKTITGSFNFDYAFYYSQSYGSFKANKVDFSALETINGSWNFNNALCDVCAPDFSSLKTITGGHNFNYAFGRPQGAPLELSFPSLETISGSANFNHAFDSNFVSTTSSCHVYFPKLTSCDTDTFQDCGSQYVTIHLPSALENAGLVTGDFNYVYNL